MNYFVTGATGFIGRNLVERLLQREGTVYVLVRAGSRGRLEELRSRWGADGAASCRSPATSPSPASASPRRTCRALRGEVDHFFHLAAIYDMTADAEAQEVANVEGTRHAVELAERDRGRAASTRSARSPPPASTRGLARGHVRRGRRSSTPTPTSAPSTSPSGSCARSARGPGASTGRGSSSATRETGEIDKIDGPYYFFKLIQRLRSALPPWLPTVGDRRRRDQHRPGRLRRRRDRPHRPPAGARRPAPSTSPTRTRRPPGEVINLFARAADAPQMAMRLDPT